MTAGDAVDGATRGHPRAPEPEGFSDALRKAIAGSGRSLESLRRRLAERGTPVSIATLSYWQSGRSQPQRGSSLRAVLHLEELLQLPHGHLLDRIGPRRRPFIQHEEVAAGGLPVDHPDAELALADLGFGGNPGLVDVTIHDTLDVDDQGIERVRTIRNVVRAVRPGARRLPALLTIGVPSGERAEFVPVSGCTVGRQVSRPEVGVFAAELLLDRPLRLGETAAAEHRVLLPRDLGDGQCIEYYLVREVTELMIWVRFSPDRLPARVVTYSNLGGRKVTGPAAPLGGSTSVQHVLHHVGPGVVGVRWEW
jgi:hypothetical protein